jgi:hypothetical protein
VAATKKREQITCFYSGFRSVTTHSPAYAADQLDLDGALGALRGVVDTSVGAAQKLE